LRVWYVPLVSCFPLSDLGAWLPCQVMTVAACPAESVVGEGRWARGYQMMISTTAVLARGTNGRDSLRDLLTSAESQPPKKLERFCEV
jgi:hypothetical protein